MSTLRGLFVTGTDTNAGKTLVSCAVIAALRTRGMTVAGMKPVASGATRTANGPRNDDALALQHAAGIAVAYDWINPYCFVEPIAPHIAARRARQPIDVGLIVMRAQQLLSKAEMLVVEGVGGWKVPLNENHTSADLAVALGLPVVLVVGLKLGCINHALLTADSIEQHGLSVAGWIANSVTPRLDAESDIIDTLRERLPGSYWGHVPYLPYAATTNLQPYLHLPHALPRVMPGHRID